MDKVLKGARTCTARGEVDNAATLLLHLWSDTPEVAGLRETGLEPADRFPLSQSAAEVLYRAAVISAEGGPAARRGGVGAEELGARRTRRPRR